MATGPKPYASLDKVWKAFGGLSNYKTPAVNGERFFFLACFFLGSAIARPVGAPARRSWARPRPRAVSDAFMAEGVEQ